MDLPQCMEPPKRAATDGCHPQAGPSNFRLVHEQYRTEN